MNEPRCLIVDADRKSAETLAGIMGRHGFSTHILATPFEALRTLRKETFDLILFDISTRDADGPLVLEQIKSEMPALVERTVIVAANPLFAADVTGGIAIIGKSDLRPMMRYLTKD